MAQKNLILLDFDCTLSGIESLNYFFTRLTPQEQLKCLEMTELAMAGKISFEACVGYKINSIKLSYEEACDYGKTILNNHVNEDKFILIEKFKQMDCMVAIASGGIGEIIAPTAQKMGLRKYCVELQYDISGKFLSMLDNGFQIEKHIGLKKVITSPNDYKNIIMIGDGYNDYLTYKHKIATHYIPYCEHLQRDFISEKGFIPTYTTDELVAEVTKIITQSGGRKTL